MPTVFHGGPALRKEESKARRCAPEAVLGIIGRFGGTLT